MSSCPNMLSGTGGSLVPGKGMKSFVSHKAPACYFFLIAKDKCAWRTQEKSAMRGVSDGIAAAGRCAKYPKQPAHGTLTSKTDKR